MSTPVDATEGGEDLTRVPASRPDASYTIGPYRLVQRLGEGGMGDVWLAEQQQPVRRTVALKILKAGMDTSLVVARFEAERQALALMDHPAIAKVFDGGTTRDGRPYFAMEYVRGEPITQYCDRQRLSVAERLELFVQLCEGVQHAHQKGVIHRDLKPSNVLVAMVDDRPGPRIIDFGIAKAVAQPLTERPLVTEIGSFIGTPEYMSPEQADLSSLDVDTRSDVYSLGVLLYELLSGTLPFDPATLRQSGLDGLRRTIREQEPPRPSTRITRTGQAATALAEHRSTQPIRLAGLLRGDLDWITMKALEKDRTRRYPTANALALDIVRHLRNEPVSAGPPSAFYRTGKFVRRHRAGVAAGTSLLLLLMAFSVATVVQSRRVAQERDRASREAEIARQVSDFLVGLFRTSDPSQARGKEVTAREILDRGARQIDEMLRGQPEVQGRLQATIGEVYMSLGAFEAAQQLLERAVSTERASRGDDHPGTLAARHQLANLYWWQGKYTEAETLYLDVVARRTRVLGERHPQTLKANFDLASVYAQRRNWNEAEQLQRRTLEMQRSVLGPAHFDTIASENNLVGILHGQRRFTEALPIAIEVTDVKRRTLGDDHPSTLVSLHNLAFSYEALQDAERAEQLYRQTLSRRQRVLGEQHASTASTRMALARIYLEQRRYAEAEAVALAAYDAYRAALGPEDANAQRAASRLVQIYEGWGRKEKASEWRARLLQPPTGQ